MKRCVIKNLLFMAGMFLLIFCFLPAKVNAELPNDNFIRCSDWLQIDELLERICAKQNA